MPKQLWKIEGFDGAQKIFEQTVDGELSQQEIAIILQRLVCKFLSEKEIVGSSLRKNHCDYLVHLEPQFDNALGRHHVMVGDNPHYIATMRTT